MPLIFRIVKNVFWISLLICLDTHGQSDIEQELQIKAEELFESSSDEVDLTDLTDRLDDLRNHPVNLNKTSINELRQLPFLTEKQITSFILYRETYGAIYSIYELRAIDGFDSTTIRQIMPFITISNESDRHSVRFRELFSKGRCQFLVRYQQILQSQKGYNTSDSSLKMNPGAGYWGSPQKYYFRFRYNYFERISIGLTGEKDPGEGVFTRSQPYGMDFYSGYFALKNTGFVKSLIVGNYNADFGQGLTLCSSLSFGALPSSGNLRRMAAGITPSLSTNENNYLRGLAVSLKIKRLNVSFIYSRHRKDANVISVDSISGETKQFSSFLESGYHRNQNEIADKHAVREVIYGGNINFRNDFFTVGVTGFHSLFNASCHPGSEPYRRYAFSGRSNLNAGIDFQFIFRTIYGFGEIARSLNGGMAWLAGIQVNPGAGIKFSLICRDFQRSYQNFLSNAIGQNSNDANEKGLIFNFSSRITSKSNFYAYFDIFRHPWLKYNSGFLSYGTEMACHAEYTPSKAITMLLRYRIRCGQINESGAATIRSWINSKTESLRYQTDWQVSHAVSLRNRFELIKLSKEKKDPEYGYLISQDLYFKPQNFPLSLSFRYALFNTGSYATRIYTYENDVLYGYSVPALEGKGIRCYLLIASQPFKFLECWVRYAHFFYSDRNVIGNGPETITGNTKSEIKIQVMLRI